MSKLLANGMNVNITIMEESPNNESQISITILPAKNGEPGYTPQKGIDYWTPEDKEEIIQEILDGLPQDTPGGGIVPPGDYISPLPSVGTDDNGKILAVENGMWVAKAPASTAEKDNTTPITSAAVYETVGNINALLETI